ncbi:MAG: ABC transporter substrate-binding protein [Rhodospirillales bacterium]|nr:ABC transporter substrate-binding protein [Rhodospirillales bacterium]
MLRHAALAFGLLAATFAPATARTIEIRIGHQSMCTDTYPAGEVVMHKGLLAKYLPHTGKYAGMKYDIEWSDYSSGGPITQMMMARKLDFGVMGDYPLVVNGARFQATDKERSYLIALTNYNLDGASNGIVVPVDSPVRSVRGLEGKTISVPIGSAAWGMLFEMAQDQHIPMDKFHIVNQTPMVGIASITMHKIDAHADFCPMSEFMEFNGTGRMIYSGAATHVPYLHGIVVTRAFADKYPEIAVAYVKALIAAQAWITADPERAATKLAKWTMIPKEVLYLYFSHGGYLNPDPTFKPLWLKTLAYDHSILAKYAHIPPLDMKAWVNPSFMETAYKELGLNYAKALATTPDNPKSNIGLPPELWLAGQHVRRLPDNAALLAAIRAAGAANKKIDAAYVYDQATGLKLFAQFAYYVKQPDGRIAAYMTTGEATHAAGTAKVQSFAETLGVKGLAEAMIARRQMPMHMSPTKQIQRN